MSEHQSQACPFCRAEDADWHQQVLDSSSRPPLSAEALQTTVERLRRAAQEFD